MFAGPLSGFPGAASTTEQTARASLMGLEFFEAWLIASRRMIDLWRTTVREQQDTMLANWRTQITDALADAETRDLAVKAPAPERLAAAPPPTARSRSVAVRSPQPAA
jgi:hypothetical protein